MVNPPTMHIHGLSQKVHNAVNLGPEIVKGIYYQKSAWAPSWHKERIGLLPHFLMDREGALALLRS